MEIAFTCSICGGEHPRSELTEFDGQLLCPNCLEEATVICSHCGDRIWRDDNAGDSDTPLCESCYDRHYTFCARCGRVIRYDDACYLHDDDDEGYCPSCFEYERTNDAIENYYYKPAPIFYGKGRRYFGVELEIDEGGERSKAAQRLMDIANGCNPNYQNRLYCKHDGSLDDGFELVTHPMTLEYHMNKMPWPDVLTEAIKMGYTSHQARSCGLHVHVNRDAFGKTEADQEEVIARILFFVENHWNELLRFSRRTKTQMEHWAARYGRKDDPKTMMDHAKKSNLGRYTCVNLTNESTIEFRMFRGTLKLNTFLATLQMVDHICEVALNLSDQEMQELAWSVFAAGCTAPELVQYLKERRLYVSEPVTASEEV